MRFRHCCCNWRSVARFLPFLDQEAVALARVAAPTGFPFLREERTVALACGGTKAFAVFSRLHFGHRFLQEFAQQSFPEPISNAQPVPAGIPAKITVEKVHQVTLEQEIQAFLHGQETDSAVEDVVELKYGGTLRVNQLQHVAKVRG